MGIRLKPEFWNSDEQGVGPTRHMFRFRRIWLLAVILTSLVTLIPLTAVSTFDIRVARESIQSAIWLRTARLVSNTKRTLAYFLDEHKRAVNFILADNTLEELSDPDRLTEILSNLNKSFPGFGDIGLINADGVHVAYVGSFNLEHADYSNEEWFRQVSEEGAHISDVFLGLRQAPHMVIALRHVPASGRPYYLRVTVDTMLFTSLLSGLEIEGHGEAFIINREGIIQTPSDNQGEVLSKMHLPVPEYSEHTRVYEYTPENGDALLVGYAYIPDSPFILMITKKKQELMRPWVETRNQIIWFWAVSAVSILIVILCMSTFLTNRIYQADERRLTALHQVEYENKLASIGRLAAGVAHEINNPLAIINEKAGLIKDMFHIKKKYEHDEKLLAQVNSIIASVERCGVITKRLLGFSRNLDSHTEPVHIRDVVEDVFTFLEKAAEHKAINISVDIGEDVPSFVSDRGKLQQIFLNLINNAFAAMDSGGSLWVEGRLVKPDSLQVTVRDTGGGIPEHLQDRIFEPFFSTKKGSGGTGLGLNITYNLVQELGGSISVKSKVNVGTTFTVVLPLTKGGDEE